MIFEFLVNLIGNSKITSPGEGRRGVPQISDKNWQWEDGGVYKKWFHQTQKFVWDEIISIDIVLRKDNAQKIY